MMLSRPEKTNPILPALSLSKGSGLQFGCFLLTPAKPCVIPYVPHRGFRPKHHTFSQPRIKKMQNEPNLKNT